MLDDPRFLYFVFAAVVFLVSVTFFGGRFAIRRRGSVDFDRWRSLAETRGWSFTSTSTGCRLVARIDGAQVIANAVGTHIGRTASADQLFVRRQRHNPANDALVVATSILAPIAGTPPGFSLRQRSLADSVAGLVTASIPLDDERLSAAVIVTGEGETARLMARADVRDAILGLVGFGTFSMATDVIQLSTGDLLNPVDLELLVERVAVLAVAIGFPEPEVRPIPIPTAPAIRRSRLGTLVQRVASTASTKFGQSAADDLTGRPVNCEMELDTIHLRHGLADGSQGVMLIGIEVRGTTRIEMNARASCEEIRRMMPGTRVTADATIESYDGVRDRAELRADGPLTLTDDPEPNAKRQRDATFAKLADEIAEKNSLSAVVEVLYAASATRARLLVNASGREYLGELVPLKHGPVKDGFIPEAARRGTRITGLVGKREVEVLAPESCTEIPADIRATIIRWDEFAGRPVLMLAPVVAPAP
jgi:hypothetical protein